MRHLLWLLFLLAPYAPDFAHAQEQPEAQLPVPVAGLTPGTSTYDVRISMSGQQMNLELTRTVEEVEGAWRVTESVQGPMGEASDVETLSKPSLKPISRSTRQGPAAIDLTYTDTKIEGTFVMGGAPQPVSTDLEGPVFSDGAGASLIISALPLAEGYATTYPTFDLMTQTVKSMQAAVAALESVTVPAGTFDTYRVEVSTADGSGAASKIWISRDGRQVVKTEANVPQMGNAVVVSELKESSEGR